ncbi:hypothetical protein K2Q02_00875 [Patescibacteria group bacterium]|nr:hypothetical protein [Patescibacteria group bacterium]
MKIIIITAIALGFIGIFGPHFYRLFLKKEKKKVTSLNKDYKSYSEAAEWDNSFGKGSI